MGEPEGVILERYDLAVDGHEAGSGLVRGEQLNPEAGGECRDAILCGTHPLPAEFDHHPVGQRMVQDPPAYAVPGFDDDDRQSPRDQIARRRQSGGARDSSTPFDTVNRSECQVSRLHSRALTRTA